MKNRMVKIWGEYKGFVFFVVLMLVFRSAVADWNEVPTGSMKPTIVEGDRIWVNKMAYDIRLPFTHISLIRRGDPVRGDIVIFDSKVSDKRLVKRVIGVPGDVLAMVENHLVVNGQVLDYVRHEVSDDAVYREEVLLDTRHTIRLDIQASPFASFRPVQVPPGHYLVLGDNRDQSADSRVIGFVPREEIVGRARHVVLSFDYGNYYIPRSDRFFQRL